MAKDMFNVIVFAWLILLPFVFSCESNEKKELTKLRKENNGSMRKNSNDSNSIGESYDLRTNKNFQADLDSVLKRVTDSFDATCKKDIDCRKKQYEAIKQGLEGCKKDSICFKEAYEKRKSKLKEWE